MHITYKIAYSYLKYTRWETFWITALDLTQSYLQIDLMNSSVMIYQYINVSQYAREYTNHVYRVSTDSIYCDTQYASTWNCIGTCYILLCLVLNFVTAEMKMPELEKEVRF